MKRVLTALLIVAMIISLCACGSATNPSELQNTENQETDTSSAETSLSNNDEDPKPYKPLETPLEINSSYKDASKSIPTDVLEKYYDGRMEQFADYTIEEWTPVFCKGRITLYENKIMGYPSVMVMSADYWWICDVLTPKGGSHTDEEEWIAQYDGQDAIVCGLYMPHSSKIYQRPAMFITKIVLDTGIESISSYGRQADISPEYGVAPKDTKAEQVERSISNSVRYSSYITIVSIDYSDNSVVITLDTSLNRTIDTVKMLLEADSRNIVRHLIQDCPEINNVSLHWNVTHFDGTASFDYQIIDNESSLINADYSFE